jgi:hypothetical protein
MKNQDDPVHWYRRPCSNVDVILKGVGVGVGVRVRCEGEYNHHNTEVFQIS